MVNNVQRPRITAAERFKLNLDKRFVEPARNNNLWGAFTEFKQKTENDEIFAKCVQSPNQRKEINKIILDAFSKIDTSKTKFKYYKSMSKLKDRILNKRDLFSNSYLKDKKSPFMDNIMQEIINRDISFLKDTDKKQFYNLFHILESDDLKTQPEKFKAINDLYNNVLPEGSKEGKFTSVKVAHTFEHLTELAKNMSNYQSFLISSSAVNNTTNPNFDEDLKTFRLDLKKSFIPSFEVANMYNRSLGVKPLDIASFINKQEEMFVDNFKKRHPNIEVNYSKPDLNEVYSFVRFPKKNYKLNRVAHVEKSAISENLKKASFTIKKIASDISKSLEYTSKPRKFVRNVSKNKVPTMNKKPIKIEKSSIMRDGF